MMSKRGKPDKSVPGMDFTVTSGLDDPKHIARVQQIYSSLFLDDKIDSELFVSSAICTALALMGMSPYGMETLARDFMRMHEAKGSLQRLIDRLQNRNPKTKEANNGD